MNKVSLNNQQAIVLFQNELTLIKGGSFEGSQIDLFHYSERAIELCEKYNELGFALFKYSPMSPSWSFCIVVNVESTWRRVHIEFPVCESCGNKCISANHMMYSLYFSVPDSKSAYKAAGFLPEAPCPNCGETLPRPSVWNRKIRN